MASEIRVNSLTNRSGLSTVTIADTGVVVAGMVTATDAIFTGDITATNGSFSGNVDIAGALTYEDVTNVDSIGIITARDAITVKGNPAEVRIQHTGNSSYSRLISDSNNQLNIYTGGGPNLAMVIDQNQNIGIGTDNPGHLLDLYNSAGSDCLRLNVNGGAGGSNKQNAIRFSVDGDVKAHMGLAVDAGRLISGSIANDFCLKGLGSNNILFATNSSEKLRITTGGNIGVGGATGTDFTLLDGIVTNTANGSAGLLINSSSSSHNAYLGFSYGSGSGTSHADQFSAYIGRVGDNKLILGTNNTIRLNIDSSGRVGIQGDPTRALLEVRASGGSNTMLTALWGANEGTTTGTLSDNTDKAVRMGVQHYDTDALPYAFLVGSSTSSANNLTFGGGTSLMNAATEIKFVTASNTTTTTGTERLRIAGDGNITLGYGGASLWFQNGFNDSNSRIQNGGGSNNSNLRFYTRSSGTEAERLRIQSDGNVIPLSNGAHNLGLSGNKWNKVWTNYVRYGTRSATYERTLTATSNGSGDLTFECGVLWLVDDSSFEVLVHIDRTGTYNSIAARYKFYGSKVSGFGTQGTYRSDTSNFYIISPMSNPVIDSYTPSGHGTSHGTRIRHTSAVANAEYRITMLINWVGQREIT